MPDFSQLMRQPAGAAKKPVALPMGDYPAVIKSFENGDQNANKTPYLRFHIGLTNFPDSITEEERADIDLSKKQLRRDFYLTPEAFWRLDEFFRSVGVQFDGVKTYEELAPEVVGASVIAEVQQYVNQKTSEIGNQVGKLIGA